MYFPVFEIDCAYDILQRRYQRFLCTIADNIDIVTASVNDFDNGSKIASIVPIYCQTFYLKPVVFTSGKGGEPVPRDQHLIFPKSFSSSEILVTLQPDEYALMHHSPLGQYILLHTGAPVLQEDVPLHKIRQ